MFSVCRTQVLRRLCEIPIIIRRRDAGMTGQATPLIRSPSRSAPSGSLLASPRFVDGTSSSSSSRARLVAATGGAHLSDEIRGRVTPAQDAELAASQTRTAAMGDAQEGGGSGEVVQSVTMETDRHWTTLPFPTFRLILGSSHR